MEINPVLIIGTSPEGRIALDIFNENNVLVYAFVTDKKEESGEVLNDISIFASVDHPDVKKVFAESNVDYFIAAGEPDKRRELQKTIGTLRDKPATNAVHRLAFISGYASIGFGNLINAGVIVNANVSIGDSNFLHSSVSIEPDAAIGSFCTINSGVRIGSNVEIQDEVFIGTGAVIYPGVKIGKGAIIGAGSVVLRSVNAGKTVFGNPAVEAK